MLYTVHKKSNASGSLWWPHWVHVASWTAESRLHLTTVDGKMAIKAYPRI